MRQSRESSRLYKTKTSNKDCKRSIRLCVTTTLFIRRFVRPLNSIDSSYETTPSWALADWCCHVAPKGDSRRCHRWAPKHRYCSQEVRRTCRTPGSCRLSVVGKSRIERLPKGCRPAALSNNLGARVRTFV